MLQLVLPGAQQDTLSSATGRTVGLCDASSFTLCLCDAGVRQEGDQSHSVWGCLTQGLVALANCAVSGVSEVTWIRVGSWQFNRHWLDSHQDPCCPERVSLMALAPKSHAVG